MLVAEALDRDLQRARSPSLLERRDQPGLQLVDVEVGRVDDQIGRASEPARARRARARSPRASPSASSASGCLRRVASYRRTSSGVDASRKARSDTVTGGAQRGDVGQHVGVLAAGRRAPGGRCHRPASPPARRSCRRSEVGRLSTTYQPRSSSTAAAADRPAPDKPGDQDDVGHRLRIYRRVARAADGDTAGAGSSPPARTPVRGARNPAGGAGSIHPLEHQTVVGEGVEVARQRSMDEADVHALLDLLDRSRPRRGTGRSASTARADRAPGRRSSRCSGVCSSGWLRKKQNRPPATQHAGDLGDRVVDVVDVLEHEARDDRVERRVGERQRRRPPRARSAGPPPRSMRDAELVPRRVDADDVGAALAASIRLICPSPHPTSRTIVAPASSAAASGRICSSYSGSAPSVKPSIHQPAWCSHRSRRRIAVSRGSRGGALRTSRRMKSSRHGLLRLAGTVRPGTKSLDARRAAPTQQRLARDLVRRPLHAEHRGRRVADGDTHECWAILPALAATTERVRLGSLVSPTTVHHPALLANRISTVDHISNGRAVLGLGAGWQVNEHRAYGIELPSRGARVERFEEAIQIVRALLDRAARPRSPARTYTITDAPCEPKPIQSPLPILVGTRGSRMMRITARHADEWNTWGDIDAAATKTARSSTCVRRGRPRPGDDAPSVQAHRVPGRRRRHARASCARTHRPGVRSSARRRSWSTRWVATATSASTSSSSPNGTSAATRDANARPSSARSTTAAAVATRMTRETCSPILASSRRQRTSPSSRGQLTTSACVTSSPVGVELGVDRLGDRVGEER